MVSHVVRNVCGFVPLEDFCLARWRRESFPCEEKEHDAHRIRWALFPSVRTLRRRTLRLTTARRTHMCGHDDMETASAATQPPHSSAPAVVVASHRLYAHRYGTHSERRRSLPVECSRCGYFPRVSPTCAPHGSWLSSCVMIMAHTTTRTTTYVLPYSVVVSMNAL